MVILEQTVDPASLEAYLRTMKENQSAFCVFMRHGGNDLSVTYVPDKGFAAWLSCAHEFGYKRAVNNPYPTLVEAINNYSY